MKLSGLKFINGIVLPVLILFSACSKSGGENSGVKSKTELIASSTWKYNAAGIDQDVNGTSDIPLPAGILKSCDTDNTITFKADHTGTIDEGPSKCDPALPQTAPFTWSLTNNETNLTVSTSIIAGIGGDAKIIEITATKFVLSKQVTVPGIPIPVTVIVDLVH